MGREQLLNQIASGSGSPSRSSTTKTTSNSDSKAAGRDRLLKQIGGYGSKTALDEDKYSEFENLYNQYESDVSGIYDSYNARAKKTGYKSGAQDFYDKTMAATTAARTSSSALTDWLNKNRDSFSYDDYTELIGAIKQNQTGLDKILDEAKSDAELYTRGRGSESGLRSQWLKNNGVRVAPWRPSKSELETWTEDYVKANQELKDAQKALKKITPTEGMTLDDAQREYGTARIAAQQRVDDAQDKLDELGAKLEKYGGAVPKTELSAKDWFNAVRYGFRSGITSADQAIAKGLDFFLGDALGELQTLGGETVRLFNPDFDYNEKNLLDRYVDWSQSHLDVQRERAAEAVGINSTAQKVNQYTEMVFNSLPMSVMAIMSGGATAAPQASTEALKVASAIANSGKAQQLLTPVLNAVKNMANDPNWQFTFMSTVGDSYEDALADGASNEDAVINALLNAAANATIEVGGGDEALGGLQKLPKPLREALQRGDKSGVLQILKSIPSEAGEEIMQGIAEAGIKGIYKDVPLFSMNDEGAVISPSRMLDEAKGAAVVSAVLGGGQYAAEAGLNAAERSRTNKTADAVAKQLYGDSADTLVQQGLESPVDSKSYKLARQYQAILDNNGELSGKQIRKLVQANSEQIRTEGETEAQAQTGADEEAAQQTAPQTQSTPAAQTNTETGAQTATQQTRPTGAMEAIYKGQVGNVVSLTKTDKGWAATIEQPNGKRSNVMEWQAVFDPDTQGILDAFRPSAYADEMLKTYALTDEQAEPKTYALAFNTVADIYGKSTSLTKQQAQEASRRDGGAAAILTDEQFSRAFDAGRNSKDSSIQNSVTRKSSKGAVGFKGVQYQGMTYRAATKDMVSDAELSVLKTMSKAVGVDMVLYQSEEQNGEYQGANGFYRNGTVYLDVHAGATKTTEQSAILLTAAHELTHYLRENNAEAYAGLQDFVMQHLIESGTDIETLAKKKVDKERGLISMEDAAEEVIADSCEMMLENTQVPQMMAKENPGLFAQIREWLAEFAAKLRRAFEGVQARSAEAQAMMQYAEELQQIWDNALAGAARNVRNNGTDAANNGTTSANNGTGTANNGTTSGKNKRSIREIGDTGMRYVKADRQVLFGNDPREWGEQLTKYINKEIRKGNDVLLTAPDGEIIKLTNDTAEKGAFRNTDYGKDGRPHVMTDTEYETKLNAEAHVDELIQVSGDKYKGRPNVPDYNGVHGEFARDGWRYRQAYFMDHDGKYYDLTLSVAHGRDGKVAYNIANIKERSFPNFRGSSNPKTGAQGGKASLDARVSQPAGEVKGKSSMRERDEDLQKKYPKLNLNEDISELDGVPAVELTDGSVLPILDRDRYPTHVSFIEGNRIDVDDLRSGGWIGDGVYDPSFTSDTARYIERKQAGKRVAELRGVPFNQFEDDGKSSMREQTDKDRDKRQAEINQEIKRLKKTREERLNANPNYLAAAEQIRYARAFTERVAASKAIKAAEAEVDTAEIDSQIEALQHESNTLRDAEKREYEAAREKYSGAKTRGYSRYADTRTAELDSEYEQAVKSGDKKKQRALVFEAAERAMPNSVIRGGDGKLKPVYHYTNNNFTKFDRSRARTGNEMDGFFFAPDVESTREYGNKRISAFLNITNPAYDPYLDRKHNDSGTLLREKLAYEGYDGVIRTEDGRAYEYMAFDPEQIKSAELITYDDAGNVIPLSERFNSERDDIRYSMRDNTTDDTAAERKGRQESYANLRAENAKLREQLDYWKGQTKRTKEKTVRKTDADAYAKRLTEQLHNPEAREQVADEIERMGDYIVQTPGSELSYTEVKDWALAIADYALQDSQTVIDDSQAESLQQLYGYLKDNKLRVTDDTFNDLPEGWVRQHRGRIKLSEDGLDVDTAWGELQEKFGEGMFPSDITAQADMLMHIADTIEAMKPTYGNPFAGYMGEMREAVAQDILDTVLSDEIRQTAMTAADRAQARLDKRIAQDTARYNALRDEKNARIEQVYQEGVARRQEAVAKEKAAKWAKVAETKQYYQNMAQQAAERRRESADIKKYRDRVAATAEQLSDWLLKNSDKEHVPEVLKQVVGEFLSTIDFSSKSRLQGGENTYNDRQFLQRLDKLEQMLRNQRDYLNSADNENAREDPLDMYLDLPAEILDELRDIRSEVTRLTTRDGGYTINQMPAGELRRLDAVLSAISHSIRKANTLFSNAQYNSVQQVAQTTIVEMDKLGAQTKETTGAGRFFQWDNATPYYAFKKLGAGARSIFKGLMQGWDKMAFNSKEIIDFTNKLYTAKEAREWQEKVHNVRIGNNTVQITTAQLMSLHCLVKRTQAMQHIMGGGFKVSVIKQSGIGKDNIAQTKQYKPTLEELAMLDGLLTNRQRKVADELQKFMVDVCGEWGNEVSMKRFGYRAFGEANYFPIVSDANVLKAVDPEAKANDMFRLLNMSATKSLNVKANNALVVSDIFEVFTNHSADMAKYNALALPLLDAIKWYNYKESTKTASGRVFTNTVQLSLEAAYGNAAKAYITKFIKDLNGVREGGTSQSDKLAKRMVSRYKAAAVGANIRVAIQQPTAYVRAAMAIDPKYLAAALKPGGHKASTAEMEKYSGIATWKGLGFVSTDIGRSMRSQIMHTESWVDSVTDKTMILAEKGDSVTWSALWRACKLETQEKTKLRGEELNKATADRFQEVIYQTQVVDATMTRSQAMRSQGTMEAITTSFMAEPTLSYNLMLDAYAEYQAEARRTGNKAAALQHSKGKLAKTIAIYAASGAATLIASSFWDAWRDDDDYETFLQKWAQAFFGEAEDKWYEKPLLQELFLLNKLPGVKDIISIITGDDVSRMDLEGAKNLIKAARIMEECLKLATGKLEEQDAQYGNMTGYGKLANILKGVSQFTGLPLYNFTRDMAAIWNTTLSNVTGVKLTVYKPNSKREIKNAYVNGLMTDEQAMDELVKQGAADDADQAFWIINDWNGDGSSSDKMSEIYDAVRAGDTGTYDALVKELTDHGVFETKIQNDVKNQIRDWYQGGDTTQATISKQDALDMLQKYGGKAEKAADTLVEQWTCEKVTGISYWNIGDEYINGNISEARALELQAKYGYGDVTKQMPAEIASNKEAAHDKLMQWKLEKETGISAGGDSFTGIREAYNAGKISKQEVYDYRIKYAGDTPEQAANTAYRYEWIGGDTRMNSVTGNQAHRYDDYVAASGMSKIDYWNAIDGHGASSFPADLVEGSKTRYVKNSKRDKIWDYVDSLNLTPRQKDALATAYAYDVNADVKSTSAYFDFEDAPWNN